jgi:asparagine synthase (glutamine-hydrolysing)
MCGLAGFFGNRGPECTHGLVASMLKVQRHRGPDSTGIWCGTIHGVDIGLGLNRLKILDLSDAANQPMISENGRYTLVYNGEIYNYVELRQELRAAGVLFRTQGDTEVVLQALVKWGPDAFARMNGMWAVVLLDNAKGEITLSRDRFGVKPLYTYFGGEGFFVASEIKAILQVAGRRFEVARDVANAYVHQGLLCLGRDTFFKGIEEFPAGHLATLQLQDLANKQLQNKRYWTITPTYSTELSERELIQLVRDTFVDAVKIRLRSDVPIGVLLSGGIDSSAIAATAHDLDRSRDDIKLLSAVGDNGSNDEQPFINIMENYLHRPVEKLVLHYSPAEALEMMSEATWFNDEPIGSFSTVAHWLLMKKARELGVTVLLSGQGADEILCGYKKYLVFYLHELLRGGHFRIAAQTGSRFVRNGNVLSQFTYQEAKRYLPRWLRFSEIDVRGPALLDTSETIPVGLNGHEVIARQVVDLERLSVPALVHYEDRMSMAAAREIRLPFLDYRLVSLLVSLPVEYKLRDGWTKWIFRRAMQGLLPNEIAWRKDKQHFIVPQNEWFRSELRGQVLKLLATEWLTEHLGLIDRPKLRARYEAYLRQTTGNGLLSFKDIFSPIALELWARRFENHLCR